MVDIINRTPFFQEGSAKAYLDGLIAGYDNWHDARQVWRREEENGAYSTAHGAWDPKTAEDKGYIPTIHERGVFAIGPSLLLRLDRYKNPVIGEEVTAVVIYTGEYPRAQDDGRCLICEGWGCWQCNGSGGY